MKFKVFNCGELNETNKNELVLIHGFVDKLRKMGKITFIDLRDSKGKVQLIISEQSILPTEIKEEFIISIEGKVILRKTSNDNMPTGKIEVEVTKIEIISETIELPFPIKEEINALEPLRLKYRFLDLRRPKQQQMLIDRHNIIKEIRDFYNENSFIEVETPILTKTTPEGAKEFIVPTYSNTHKFYSLAQSPQIYKQLLISSGVENYFQIARCFRDEDLRSDRQPEFTQLDVERSFVSQDDILSQTELMIQKLFKKIKNVNIKIPFQRMEYDYAIENYGSDKPDLRFDMKIIDATEILKNSKMNLFKDANKNNLKIKSLLIDQTISKNQIKKMEDIVKKNGSKGLAFYILEDGKISGSVSKFMDDLEIEKLKKIKMHKVGLFIVDSEQKALNILGVLRNEIGEILNIVDPKEFNFSWIVNWPLFETKEDGTLKSLHHPFTKPKKPYTKIETAYSETYDIVLNGTEIGGGSIRISDKATQLKIFKALSLTEEEINEQFGFFLKIFDYSLPPHGGIAIGIDRLISLMYNTNSIRDVIAFPKNTSGFSEMELSPSKISEKTLEELGLKMNKNMKIKNS